MCPWFGLTILVDREGEVDRLRAEQPASAQPQDLDRFPVAKLQVVDESHRAVVELVGDGSRRQGLEIEAHEGDDGGYECLVDAVTDGGHVLEANPVVHQERIHPQVVFWVWDVLDTKGPIAALVTPERAGLEVAGAVGVV